MSTKNIYQRVARIIQKSFNDVSYTTALRVVREEAQRFTAPRLSRNQFETDLTLAALTRLEKMGATMEAPDDDPPSSSFPRGTK